MKAEVLDKAPVVTTPTMGSALVEQESRRAVSEVQGAIMLAKQFPRNVQDGIDKIMIACQRPTLAESAIYSYAKGGTEITGPSIRLAETIAQNWQNLQFGIRELEQRAGESTVEAFAWDVETNVRQVKVFTVKHTRYTRKGSYALDDPREIYEMVANQGARRLRACILGIIPGDIVEAAVEECEKTMKAKADTGPDARKKLIEAFEELGISREQIEKRIQRRIDTITSAQVVSLRKIYNSLKDGMSTVSDWFEVAENPETEKKGVDAAKEALKKEKVEDKTSSTLGEDALELTPEQCHEVARVLKTSLSTVKSMVHYKNWENKHKAEINEIKRVEPEVYESLKKEIESKVATLAV